MKEGILYSLFGNHEKLWKEFQVSLRSLRKHHPNLPVCLVTNAEVPAALRGDIQHVVRVTEPLHFFKLKVLAFLKSPFERTIFLDLDTQLGQPVSDLFEFLRIYDVAVAPDPLCDWTREDYFIDYHNFANLNTGVLAYRRSDKMQQFLQTWFDAFKDQPDSWFFNEPGKADDQDWFNQLVQKDKVLDRLQLKLLILPNTLFNARPWIWRAMKNDGISSRTKVRHAHDLVNSKIARLVRSAKYRMQKKTNHAS